jgi:hypothetical protein
MPSTLAFRLRNAAHRVAEITEFLGARAAECAGEKGQHDMPFRKLLAERDTLAILD